jgi:hypothetical protein
MGIFSQPQHTAALPPAQPQSNAEQMEQQIDGIYGYDNKPPNPEDESAMAKFMKYLIALRRSQMSRSQTQYRQMV